MGLKENEKLVNELKERGVLRKTEVIEAFKKVDRANFVPNAWEENAYVDTPLPIGEGQTISAPHMVAMMTESLDVRKGQKILEVGTGSGYQAAILSELAGSKGKVVTTEIVPELVEFAFNNLKEFRNVSVIETDGSNGYEEEAPYDRIIVTAAAPDVPDTLVDQLAKNGKMAIPVGDRFVQDFLMLTKDENGGIKTEIICGCVFVPLIGEHGFQD